ncbi:MAG TPA: hypothetical protein DD713_03335 [Nitrospiraceae bacterium]|nr:hypothetical protein [Nitrospiraceae bacterium]
MVKCITCGITCVEEFKDITISINNEILIPMRDISVAICPKCKFSLIEVQHEFVSDNKLSMRIKQK